MIEILQADNYRRCNRCTSDANVYNINIRYEGTNSGTQIALCKKCVKMLLDKLEEVLRDEENIMS